MLGNGRGISKRIIEKKLPPRWCFGSEGIASGLSREVRRAAAYNRYLPFKPRTETEQRWTQKGARNERTLAAEPKVYPDAL